MTPERIEEFRTSLHDISRWPDVDSICDLAKDGIRLRQGKVLNLMGKVKNWNHENKIYWIPRGKLLVLVDKEAKP